MGEKKPIFSKKEIKYSGLFNLVEVQKFVMGWFANHGLDMVEEMTSEQVFPEGKQIDYSYKPYKKFTDFAKMIIWFDAEFTDVQEVTVEIDGVKKKMNKGSITFTITGYLETDYENKWETKAFYYFLKIVFEKFMLGSHQSYYKSTITTTCNQLIEELKALLNMNRFKV